MQLREQSLGEACIKASCRPQEPQGSTGPPVQQGNLKLLVHAREHESVLGVERMQVCANVRLQGEPVCVGVLGHRREDVAAVAGLARVGIHRNVAEVPRC